MYQPDPSGTLRALSNLVRPGGLIAFHEMDFSVCPSWPEAPLWDKVYKMLTEAFCRGGVPADFGMRLARTFIDAGLPRPAIQAGVPVGGEPGSPLYPWIADTVRSLLPRIVAFGLASEAELDVDTLASRMEAEAVTLGSQLRGPIQFGASVIM